MFATPQSVEELVKELYPQLTEMARRFLRSERDGHTLEPTALVNEAFLKLFGKVPDCALTPTAFLALAAHQMRQVLVDYARKRNSQKRGGDQTQVPLFDTHPSFHVDLDSLTDLNDALERLGKLDARALAVVELKFFAGFTNEESAAILGVSDGTVESTWYSARLWLLRELRAQQRPARLLTKIGHQHDVGIRDIELTVDETALVGSQVEAPEYRGRRL